MPLVAYDPVRVPWFGDSQDVCAELAHPPLLVAVWLAEGRGAQRVRKGWVAPSPALNLQGKASQETPVEAPVLNKASP